MKKNYVILLITVCVTVIFSTKAFAQQSGKIIGKNISATIIDQAGNPVSGVEISTEDGSIETISNKKGTFSLSVSENTKLFFRAPGYQSRLIQFDSLNILNGIVLQKMPYQMSDADEINLPFGTLKKRRVVGDVTTIDPSQILNFDNSTDVLSVLNGRVPGLYNSSNIRGFGGALIVVDGIPQDNIPANLQEIDNVTVLKDVGSEMLYGAQASNGVILITTKHGQAFHKDFRVTLQTGVEKPKSYPNYLSAGQYMKLYNEALSNDGLPAQYDPTAISDAQSGKNQLMYPNEGYYNSTYLKSYAPFWDVIAEASGGNAQGKYYLNVGWNHISSLLKIGEGGKEKTDQIDVRGNVDYQITKNISFDMGVAGIFNNYHTYSSNPNTPGQGNFWYDASQQIPNQFPNLIPVSAISDSSIINSANLVGGRYLLGGTNQFQNNIYGNLTKTGYSNQITQLLQMNTGLNINLGFITKGFSARGYLSFDLQNFINSFQSNTYAVYQTNFIPTATGDSLALTKYGLDNVTGSQNINSLTLERNIGFYGTLNYHRIFNGAHNITGTAVAYRRQISVLNQLQPGKYLHFGLRVNYTYRDKYIAEFDGALPGSISLYGSKKYAFSPAVSFGWIMSEEPFLKNNSVVNYLKIKGGYGILNTDQGIPGQYLYENTFKQGGIFQYNGTSGNQNNSLYFNSIANNSLGWETRKELNVGFESLLLNHALQLEANYFISTLSGMYNQLNNTYPAFLGGVIPYQNYGTNRDNGIEVGLTLNKDIGKAFNISLGANMMYDVPLVIKVDEPQYQFQYQYHQGKPYDALFGYVADGLFQSQQEIDNSSPQQLGAAIQPGDIKYKDLNGDGIINSLDQKMIGNRQSRNTYGVHINIQYKSFNLFALGLGQSGADTYFNGSYYWIYGNEKYSNVVLNRWTPATAQTATYPRLSSTNNSNNFVNSTFWLHKNNWFKLQTVQLTYTLPQQVNNHTTFKSLRVYIRGSSLFTISKIKDYLDLNIGSAPQTRDFTFGIVTSF